MSRTKRCNPTHPKLFNKAAVREFVDQDYVHKLNASEKAWLEKFNKEYYNGNRDSEPLHTREQHLENQRRLNKYNTARDDRYVDGFAVARIRGQLVQPDHAPDDGARAWERTLPPKEDD